MTSEPLVPMKKNMNILLFLATSLSSAEPLPPPGDDVFNDMAIRGVFISTAASIRAGVQKLNSFIRVYLYLSVAI